MSRNSNSSESGVFRTIAERRAESPGIITVEYTGDVSAESDCVLQRGSIRDETGSTLLTIFDGADVPTLKVGEVYRLKNVYGTAWDDDVTLDANGGTSITHIPDGEIGLHADGHDETEYLVDGVVTTVHDDSGHVVRCPEYGCTNILSGYGECPDHPDHDIADGEHDLRLKLTVVTDATAHKVIVNQTEAETLLGLTAEGGATVNEMLQDTTLEACLRETLVGQSIAMTVTDIDGYNWLIADEFHSLNETPTDPAAYLAGHPAVASYIGDTDSNGVAESSD